MPFPFAEAAFILNSGRAFGDVVGLSFFTRGRALPAEALRFPHSLHENRFALPRNKTAIMVRVLRLCGGASGCGVSRGGG